jgi:hypothetical protein
VCRFAFLLLRRASVFSMTSSRTRSARRLRFGGDNERTSNEWGISGEDVVFEIGSVSEMHSVHSTLTNNSECHPNAISELFTLANNSENDGRGGAGTSSTGPTEPSAERQ